MKFDELDILREYDSRRDFVYGQFFNKILPHCGNYCRFGGMFSGEKFVQCADGLQEFIKENVTKENLTKGIFLKSIFLDSSLKTRFESTFYENVFNGKITNTSNVLDIVLDDDDLNLLLENLNFDFSKIKIIQTFIIPNEFIKNFEETSKDYQEILSKDIHDAHPQGNH